jgi:hypothetical protein
MNRDARFIEQLERYLDDYEGVTTLPEHVREVVRAELPKTKQAGDLRAPARYLSMFTTRTAQVALGLAAAALIVAVGAFLYSGRNVGSDDARPSPSVDTAPSASTASGDVCEATTARASGLGGRALEVVWCAYGPGESRQVAFTLQAPSSWADFYVPGDRTLWMRPAEGGAITLALREGESVDGVVADVTGREGYAATEATEVALGGRDGRVLDISLEEGAASGDVAPLIADDDQTWQLQEGTFTRVWVVDFDGDALMIAAGEDLADAVGDALSTIEWGS